MSIFAGLTPLPPDAILGLSEEYNRDTRTTKISLAAGVFVDESGITPVLDTVAEAEARILAAQTTKLYKPVAGDPAYLRPVRDLVFGAGNGAIADRLFVSPGTVKRHVHSVLAKTGARSRQELVLRFGRPPA